MQLTKTLKTCAMTSEYAHYYMYTLTKKLFFWLVASHTVHSVVINGDLKKTLSCVGAKQDNVTQSKCIKVFQFIYSYLT